VRRVLVVCALVLSALVHASPAGATTTLAPSSFSTEESPDCGTASVAVCTNTGSPGTAADPVMRTSLSIMNPFEPAPAPGEGSLKWARHRQVVQQTLTKSVRTVTYVWTFRVDEALKATNVGTVGTGSGTVVLTVRPHMSDCPDFPYTTTYLINATQEAIPAGTTYTATFRYGPCYNAKNIPAGTVSTFTAELYHSVQKSPANHQWDGRVDFTGALRTVSVTSSCC
jgi:hypothetical protein